VPGLDASVTRPSDPQGERISIGDARPSGGAPSRMPSLAVPAVGKDWEAPYRAHVTELMFRRLRIASYVYLGAHAVGFLVFLMLRGDPPGMIIVLRIAAMVLTVGCVAATYVRSLERVAFPITVILTLINAAFLQQVILRTGLAQADIAGVVLIVVGTGLLFPYNARQMLAVGIAVLLVYLGAVAFLSEVDWRRVAVHIFFIACAIAAGTISAGLSDSLRRREHRARIEVDIERSKAEDLLRNILPASIVEELKRHPRAIADRFPETTILFADICGFTPLSAKVSPEQLVDLLNEVFSAFDHLTEKHGLEKIKTIGDAYMVAGGLPTFVEDHAPRVARMALEMHDVVERIVTPTGDRLQVRIGINSGPVVAGVIGTKKFTYDLWGDAVNIASRMESHGQIGAIMVTRATHDRLEHGFHLEPCGSVHVKGKGEMETWLLVRELDQGSKPR
jgi:class 3 adenylate cyclase